MRRLKRSGLTLGAIATLLAVTAAPAIADTSLLVAAPGEAVVGNTVPVIVTVTEDGEPVSGAIVTLSRAAQFSGVSGYIEIMRIATAEDGTADVSYVQRAAEMTSELRIDVVDSDVAPLEFSVTSVGEPEQIHQSDVGVDLPGLGGWVLIALIAVVWLIILSTVVRLRSVAVDADAASDTAGGTKTRILPYLIPGAVAVVAAVLVTVLIRNPATHGDVNALGAADRVPHSHVGELVALVHPGIDPELVDPAHGIDFMVSPGLASPFAVLTGDPLVDGARAFFGLGCASCHGLDGMTGTVGDDISSEVGDGLDDFLSAVRKGPKGMPPYPEHAFTDEELGLVHIYLTALFGE